MASPCVRVVFRYEQIPRNGCPLHPTCDLVIVTDARYVCSVFGDLVRVQPSPTYRLPRLVEITYAPRCQHDRTARKRSRVLAAVS